MHFQLHRASLWSQASVSLIQLVLVHGWTHKVCYYLRPVRRQQIRLSARRSFSPPDCATIQRLSALVALRIFDCWVLFVSLSLWFEPTHLAVCRQSDRDHLSLVSVFLWLKHSRVDKVWWQSCMRRAKSDATQVMPRGHRWAGWIWFQCGVAATICRPYKTQYFAFQSDYKTSSRGFKWANWLANWGEKKE